MAKYWWIDYVLLVIGIVALFAIEIHADRVRKRQGKS